jgi:hypothetical protein
MQGGSTIPNPGIAAGARLGHTLSPRPVKIRSSSVVAFAPLRAKLPKRCGGFRCARPSAGLPHVASAGRSIPRAWCRWARPWCGRWLCAAGQVLWGRGCLHLPRAGQRGHRTIHRERLQRIAYRRRRGGPGRLTRVAEASPHVALFSCALSRHYLEPVKTTKPPPQSLGRIQLCRR